ncbi:MAG: hypothetical protein WB781_17755, partial [Candidatus Sulfotelmatobacter sp.]
TVGRGRRAIQSLLDFLPRTVAVRRHGQVWKFRPTKFKSVKLSSSNREAISLSMAWCLAAVRLWNKQKF